MAERGGRFLVRTRIRQRTLGEGLRLLQAASQQLRLPQREMTERPMELDSSGGLSNRLGALSRFHHNGTDFGYAVSLL